jgi:hypothetical protein
MPRLLGYELEQDFDIDKENRRNRLWWPFLAGTVLCFGYDFLNLPFSLQIFQGFVATWMFYGENFYVRNKGHFRGFWRWKVILLTAPNHTFYLAGVFWADHAFPGPMKKAIVFVPVLAVGVVIETYWIQKIIKRAELSNTKDAGAPST